MFGKSVSELVNNFQIQMSTFENSDGNLGPRSNIQGTFFATAKVFLLGTSELNHKRLAEITSLNGKSTWTLISEIANRLLGFPVVLL